MQISNSVCCFAAGGGLEAAKKGVEVKLVNLEMRESVSSVLAERVVLIVQCSRCKFKTEFATNPGQINVFR